MNPSMNQSMSQPMSQSMNESMHHCRFNLFDMLSCLRSRPFGFMLMGWFGSNSHKRTLAITEYNTIELFRAICILTLPCIPLFCIIPTCVACKPCLCVHSLFASWWSCIVLFVSRFQCYQSSNHGTKIPSLTMKVLVTVLVMVPLWPMVVLRAPGSHLLYAV